MSTQLYHPYLSDSTGSVPLSSLRSCRTFSTYCGGNFCSTMMHGFTVKTSSLSQDSSVSDNDDIFSHCANEKVLVNPWAVLWEGVSSYLCDSSGSLPVTSFGCRGSFSVYSPGHFSKTTLQCLRAKPSPLALDWVCDWWVFSPVMIMNRWWWVQC